MRIDKKSKKDNNYNQPGTENEKKKNWPQDLPIKTFKPTEKTREEKKLNIDTGLS